MKTVKSAIAILLALVMVMALCACGSTVDQTAVDEIQSTLDDIEAKLDAQETAEDAEPAEEAAPAEEDDSGEAAEPVEAPEGYPNGDIEVVIPYKVGGTTDLAVRGVLDAIDGFDYYVTNEVGASGLQGTELFLTRDVDGRTFGLVNCDLVLNYVTGATEINPAEEFIPLAAVEQDPYFLLAGKDAEYDTFEGFIAYCEEHPGEVVVGVTSVGSVPNLLGTILTNAGLDVNVVAYDSAPDAIAGVLAGEADICISAMAPCVGNIESGDLIPLAVTSAERCEADPEVPTMAEVDERFADVNLLSWIMIAVRTGTDPEIVSYLQSIISEAVESEAYAEARASFYFEKITLGVDDLSDFISEQAAYYETLN